MRIDDDQLSIKNEVIFQRSERLDDLWEALVEHFLISRKQRDLFPALHGNGAIAVEFDLKAPFLIRWQGPAGLHCIGSTNAGSVASELFGDSSA